MAQMTQGQIARQKRHNRAQAEYRANMDRYLESQGLLNYQTQGMSQQDIANRYQQAGVKLQGQPAPKPQPTPQYQQPQIAPTQQPTQRAAPQGYNYTQPQSPQPTPTQNQNSPYRYNTYKATEWMDQFKPSVPQWMYAPMDIVAGVADEPIRFFDWIGSSLRRRKQR